MSKFEYDLDVFKLEEKGVKWVGADQSKTAEQFADLKVEMNRKGSEGWELLGLHTYEFGSGLAGGFKRSISFTMWKRELPA